MVRIAALIVAVGACGPAGPALAAHDGTWRRPVDGPVLTPFAAGADPFAPHQHRGVDLGASRGSPVRSACTGRVSFAGSVGSAGRTVSVRCGRLTASYLHLATIGVRRGDRIAAGSRLGTVGTSGRPRLRRPHLHLGVRITARRWAYVDPMSLLPSDRAPGLPPLIPVARRPRWTPSAGPRLPAPVPGFRLAVPRPAPAAQRVPMGRKGNASPGGLAWMGSALLAIGASGLGLARARRGRPGRAKPGGSLARPWRSM